MPSPDKHHLFVVMNDPCPDKLCLVISITTIHDGRAFDPACVLQAGDHPFITHPSYVKYRLAETIRAFQIVKLIKSNVYIPREDFDPAIFARIAAGIYESEDVARRIVLYAEAQDVSP